MNRSVAHLIPSVQAMAVCTQQPQIAFVRSPILEAIIPGARASSLFAPVDVVDVQNSVIAFAALHANPAKLAHKSKLPAPVAGVLVDGVAVLVPVINAALFRAKAMLTSHAATLAGCLPLPSCSKVAGPVAVFPGAVLEAVKMGFKRLFAVAAGYCNSALFHGRNILLSKSKVNFDISCRRIEQAQRQGDLFIDGAAA